MRGDEGDLDKNGMLNVNCVKRDSKTNECITKQQYEEMMKSLAYQNHYVDQGDFKGQNQEQSGGIGWFWWMVSLGWGQVFSC